MARYEYKCAACKHEFEVMCKFTEREEKAVCPACGSKDVAPLFTGFNPIQPKM